MLYNIRLAKLINNGATFYYRRIVSLQATAGQSWGARVATGPASKPRGHAALKDRWNARVQSSRRKQSGAIARI